MENKYNSIEINEVYKELKSSEKGLSNEEAAKRLEIYGLNELIAKDKKNSFGIFLSQLKSPLIIILIAASLISFFLKETIDTIIILGIIFLNSILGFYQEYKSEKALNELKKYVSFKSKVLRDEKKIEVDMNHLVPGDIVFLNIGDIVPADIKLIDSQELSVNESVITGEAFPVSKSVNEKSIIYMGSSISNGVAKGIVINTGTNTEFGKTAVILSAREPQTDFQKNIKRFGGFLINVIFILTIFIFISNTFLNRGIMNSFLFALALAVGITPELLPIIITISLSSAAIHLSKRGVIVKRLVSIEDLGDIDILCMDKTGTLTENKITLGDYFDIDGNKKKEIIEYSILCNDAIEENDKIKGNEIDSAILRYIKENNITLAKKYQNIEDIEFDYKRKRMSVIIKEGYKRILITKGAPESIVGICSSVIKNGNKIPIKRYKGKIIEKYEVLSKKGYRVIGLAVKEIASKTDYTINDESNMNFLGFIIFSDPPKKTVEEAVEKMKNLKVELKILTGDNELVTKKICEDIGFKIKEKIYLGNELDEMDDNNFNKTIEEANVFARLTPEQKYRIVSQLSKLKHIVGFLGDGVNDAPALKVADVGITVESAVDIAKDSADIILLRKSLRVLGDGIKEGRKTFGNITKYILNTISANFGNMFTLAISSLFLKFIPLLPSQILMANFISDVPLMTVSTDHVDESYIRKPKRWDIGLISKFMVKFGLISSLFDFILIGVLYFVIQADVALFRTSWFFYSVVSEIIIVFSTRTRGAFWKSKPSTMLVLSSIGAIILTLILIYSPIGFLFEFEKPMIYILMFVGGAIFLYFMTVEFFKFGFYKKYVN